MTVPAATNGPTATAARPPAPDGGSPSGSGPAGGSHPFNGAPVRPGGQTGQGGQNGQVGPNGAERGAPCTAPQLRRFIKSRPYVPMHELRRRFAIDGADDDVSPIHLDPGYIFVGLPAREGQLLGELLRAGEIGYELSLDPRSPIVVGVYPMRPVPRP